MPFVICQIHGGDIATVGCRHICNCIGARQPLGNTTFVDFDGFILRGWACDSCLSLLNEHGLQEYLKRHQSFKEYPPEEEIEPLLDLLDLQPMCFHCFKELSGRYASPGETEPP